MYKYESVVTKLISRLKSEEREGVVVYMHVPGRIGFFKYKKILGKHLLVKDKFCSKKPTYLIITTNLSNFLSKNTEIVDICWTPLFKSSNLEIYKRNIEGEYGYASLSEEDKAHLSHEAREALTQYLTRNQSREYLSKKETLDFTATVDVAFWINGRPRGSFVVEGKPVIEGVKEATILAAKDTRYKLVEKKELETVCIQITVLSDLKVPLCAGEFLERDIVPYNAYYIEQGTNGWYLPQVHNQITFSTPEQLYRSLANEKCGIPEGSLDFKNIYLISVNEWIELANERKPLQLYGPVIQINESQFDELEMMKSAASSVLRAVEEDGNVQPIISFRRRSAKQVDWARAAFAGWVLAEFATWLGDSMYATASSSVYDFIKKHLLIYNLPHKSLVASYMGNHALHIGNNTDAELFADIITTSSQKSGYEPITYSQIASFIARARKKSLLLHMDPVPFASVVLNDFKKKYACNSAPAALYAELVNTYWLLYRLTSNNMYLEISKNIANLLVNQLLSDGSVRGSQNSFFSYTRGASKVYEVLALYPDRYALPLTSTGMWLRMYQYDDRNMFHVLPELRNRVVGGFRHDFSNPDVWIDSAAHVILGSLRWQGSLSD